MKKVSYRLLDRELDVVADKHWQKLAKYFEDVVIENKFDLTATRETRQASAQIAYELWNDAIRIREILLRWKRLGISSKVRRKIADVFY